MSNLETAVQEMIAQINELRAEGKCTHCAEPMVPEFKDELSRREYEISGMCQQCQDQLFEGCMNCGKQLTASEKVDGNCNQCQEKELFYDEPPF